MQHFRSGHPGDGDDRVPEPLAPTVASAKARWGALRFFLVCWVLFAMAGSAWSLATPLFASPDESAHASHAVALMQGEVLGDPVEQPGEYVTLLDAVHIPAYWGTAHASAACFAYDLTVSAFCSPGFNADDQSITEVLTWVGRYPPGYYAVVGLPTLVLDGAPAVYAMRIISAVLCAALLAAGMTALRSTRLPRPALAAGMLAITPTALFFAGVINPSGIEIAAGFATWAILLPLVLDPKAHDVPRRLLAGSLTAVVLVNSRPSSGVMAVLIGVTLLTLVTRAFWSRLGTRRAWLPPVVVAGAGGLIALGWIVAVDPTSTLGGIPAPELNSRIRATVAALHMTPRYVREQIGAFGWLDTSAPFLTLLIWAVLLGGVFLLALVVADRRGRLALVVLLGLIVFVPVVSQIPTVVRLGLIWQGRYLLPFSLGLPLLAFGLLLKSRIGRPLGQALAPLVIALVAVGHVAAVGWMLWRYGYGVDRNPILDDAEWGPPTGLITPTLLILASMGGLVFLLLREPRERLVAAPEVEPAPSDDSREPATSSGALSRH